MLVFRRQNNMTNIVTTVASIAITISIKTVIPTVIPIILVEEGLNMAGLSSWSSEYSHPITES